MPRLIVAARRFRNPGLRVVTLPLPVGVTVFTLIATREDWPALTGEAPNNEVFRATVEVSLDGGQTYTHGAAIGCEGGAIVTRTGALSPQSTLKYSLPDPLNANRIVKVTTENMVRLRTKIDLDVE